MIQIILFLYQRNIQSVLYQVLTKFPNVAGNYSNTIACLTFVFYLSARNPKMSSMFSDFHVLL